MITKLEKNQIFVFGSNLAGNHAGGAARQAYEEFGAEMGVGEGITGQSYAFPTLDENFQKLPEERLKEAVMSLYNTAIRTPNFEYLLTPVGTGIAGFSEEYMKSLFTLSPSNIKKPSCW